MTIQYYFRVIFSSTRRHGGTEKDFTVSPCLRGDLFSSTQLHKGTEKDFTVSPCLRGEPFYLYPLTILFIPIFMTGTLKLINNPNHLFESLR
jgi:hypothetical protein